MQVNENQDTETISTPASNEIAPIAEIRLSDNLRELLHHNRSSLSADEALQFRIPTLEELAVHASRLLKFRFPVYRNRDAYENLVIRHGVYPRWSKSVAQSLPVPVLEYLGQRLWHEALGSVLEDVDTSANLLLGLWWFLEDQSQFNSPFWVGEDLKLLGATDSTALQANLYDGQALEELDVSSLLEGHGYEPRWGAAGLSAEERYLLSRTMTFGLPWASLFKRMTGVDDGNAHLLSRFPRLARFIEVYRALESLGVLTQFAGLSADSLQSALSDLKHLLAAENPPLCSQSARTIRPVRHLLLVEGATEERLMPRFAEVLGRDFARAGVHILPAGGKNQVIQLYRHHAVSLSAPITVVLDQDAEVAARTIRGELRPHDQLFVLEDGEIEDTYPLSLILKTINECYEPVHPLSQDDYEKTVALLPDSLNQVERLKALWKEYELGDGKFDKIHFAGRLAESLEEPSDVPPEIRSIIEALVG